MNYISLLTIRTLRIVNLLILVTVFGCGGGTTGTSSTGELNIQGRTQKISGAPIGGATMQVFSATSGDELLMSSTDANGKFNMTLPASEQELFIEIDGQRIPELRKHFSDSSVLVTSIVKQSTATDDPNDGNAREFFNVQYTSEFHINDLKLCESLSTSNNKIYIESPINSSSCAIEIEAFSQDLANDSFYAQLIGVCNGNTSPLSIVRASPSGNMTIDISSAYNRGCKELRISTYSVQTSDSRIEFPIIEADPNI